MSDIEKLVQSCESIIELIDRANDRIADGQVMDLKDMEENIALLCQKTESAAPETAAAMKPLMARMISKLDVLATNLDEFKKKEQNKK